MSTAHESRFIITREERAVDPKTIVTEGLRIGRHPESDVWLNHPVVSRLHAGINQIEGYFYLINLSASSATTLNGRAIPFNEAEALTAGDEIQIGPFFLKVDQAGETFELRVTLEFAVKVGEGISRHTGELYQKQLRVKHQTGGLIPRSSEVIDALKVFWDKRTREKAGRPSPLHPRTPPHPGKIRFNWRGTRDLVRPWPFAIFPWALIVVATLSAVAAVKYKIAFAPAPISAPHARTSFALVPAIAKQPNGSSCTSCHVLGVSVTNKEKMNANCAGCHQTESFAPTIIRAHRDAGIGCTNCHSEHRGEEFSPLKAALDSCAKCHHDGNKKLYNGRSVHTPHGGTFGYPVKDGVWIWRGLDAEELAEKPHVTAFLRKNRVTSSQTQEWRNAQFHGIHVHRVRVVEGLDGILSDDGVTRVLSCSSCHKTGYMGVNVDRDYPRTTCTRCHNAAIFDQTSTAEGIQTLSCTSCHVQHVRDQHWASSLRFARTEIPSETRK
ncbi:MAG: FHA domain-containing protein [Pyrinomonadaceae bacterium]